MLGTNSTKYVSHMVVKNGWFSSHGIESVKVHPRNMSQFRTAKNCQINQSWSTPLLRLNKIQPFRRNDFPSCFVLHSISWPLGWKWKTKRNHCFIIILTIKIIIPPSSFSSKTSSSPKSWSSSLQFPPSSLDTYIDTLSARLVTLPVLGWPIAGATGTYQGRVSKQFVRFFWWFRFGDDSWKNVQNTFPKGWLFPMVVRCCESNMKSWKLHQIFLFNPFWNKGFSEFDTNRKPAWHELTNFNFGDLSEFH